MALPREDPAALARAGLDAKLLVQRGADAVLKMILEHGFFHADPHPGNVIYLAGNRIAMIDFGMVGRLSPTRRWQIVDLLAGIARHDEQPMLEVLLDWAGDDAVDEERLAADLGELVTDYADVALKDMRVGALIARITQLVRDHGIVMPADLTLMFKALITLEGLGRKYDPEFRLTDRLRPFLDRALAARYAPVELGRRGSANLGQLLGLLGSVPRDVARLLKDARRGRMRVDLDLKRLDSFGRKLDGDDRSHHGRHHDRVARDRLVDRDDGDLGPPGPRHAVVHRAGTPGLSVGVRQQRMDRGVDLAVGKRLN